ncbi:MAG: GGDEF domain-containing protein, partial [Gimesia chilikensis]
MLVSFEDVTELEKKKSELREMLQALHESREEIQQKNQELEYLATRDPLTSCLNRRSFYEQMETLWAEAKEQGTPLGCVLLDIDHFKSINDNHGHSTGDLVLKGIGATLME